jgi:hypothetical protein
MHEADIITLLREIRDWVHVLLLQQSPDLLDFLMDLPAAPDKPRAVQAWSTCGHVDADHPKRKQQMG